jgi:hypothetical protein
MRGVGWNTLVRLFLAELPVMVHKTDEYWGTLLLEMAHDAREDGDALTAELLETAAMRYFDGGNRLATRWRKFEARLDDGTNQPSS